MLLGLLCAAHDHPTLGACMHGSKRHKSLLFQSMQHAWVGASWDILCHHPHHWLDMHSSKWNKNTHWHILALCVQCGFEGVSYPHPDSTSVLLWLEAVNNPICVKLLKQLLHCSVVVPFPDDSQEQQPTFLYPYSCTIAQHTFAPGHAWSCTICRLQEKGGTCNDFEHSWE